jgi:hypothetical protein
MTANSDEATESGTSTAGVSQRWEADSASSSYSPS